MAHTSKTAALTSRNCSTFVTHHPHQTDTPKVYEILPLSAPRYHPRGREFHVQPSVHDLAHHPPLQCREAGGDRRGWTVTLHCLSPYIRLFNLIPLSRLLVNCQRNFHAQLMKRKVGTPVVPDKCNRKFSKTLDDRFLFEQYASHRNETQPIHIAVPTIRIEHQRSLQTTQ